MCTCACVCVCVRNQKSFLSDISYNVPSVFQCYSLLKRGSVYSRVTNCTSAKWMLQMLLDAKKERFHLNGRLGLFGLSLKIDYTLRHMFGLASQVRVKHPVEPLMT